MKPKSLGAFTLIEFMITAGITSIVLAGVSAGVMFAFVEMKQTRQITLLQADSKILSENLSSRLHGAGGGSLRPWNSVFSTQNGANEDLTVLYADDVTECLVTNSSNGTTTSIRANVDSGACCFDSTEWTGRQIVLLNSLGNAWQNLEVSAADSSTCDLTVAPGYAEDNDVFSNSTGWTSGTVLLARPFSYQLDTNRNVLLLEHEDEDNNFVTRLLAKDVFSFQVAFGYDFNPGDGRITDASSSSDEWIGNHAGDAAAPSADTLRRVSVGLVMGRKAHRTNSVDVLDGPAINNGTHYLQRSKTQVAFRNLFIYQ